MSIGTILIREGLVDHAISIAPFHDYDGHVSEALHRHFGLELPSAGHSNKTTEQDLFWCGRGQYILTSPSGITQILEPELSKYAALSDQSDAWAVLELRGEDADQVMARLCPLDVRDMKDGHALRSEFAHMMSIILPRSGGYDIWVMRSFGKTALHHLTIAAKSIAAIL